MKGVVLAGRWKWGDGSVGLCDRGVDSLVLSDSRRPFPLWSARVVIGVWAQSQAPGKFSTVSECACPIRLCGLRRCADCTDRALLEERATLEVTSLLLCTLCGHSSDARPAR